MAFAAERRREKRLAIGGWLLAKSQPLKANCSLCGKNLLLLIADR
jgi:hypothetical protein